MLSQGKLTEALNAARLSVETATAPALIRLADQIAGQPENSSALLAHSGLADSLTLEYERLYRLGAQTVTDELAAQRKTLMSPSDLLAGAAVRLKRARQRGEHSARSIADTVAAKIRQAQISGLKDGAALSTLARQTAIGQVHVEAMQNASASINDGRWDSAAQNPDVVGAYYTSVLDENTCDECEASDSGSMISLDDAALLGPPNPQCAGGDRCRCMLVYVLSADPTAVSQVIG